jgi:hypothetical protein
MNGIRYDKRTDAGQRLQQLIAQMGETLLRTSHRRLEERPGEVGGFTVTVTVERILGSVNVIMALDGAPGTDVRMSPAEVKSVDSGKLIIRLENRLGGLESLRSRSLSEIDQLTTEAAHARDDLDKPFPQADQLTAARERVRQIDEQLKHAAGDQPREVSDRVTATLRNQDDPNWLAAAAMHDAAVTAGIPDAHVILVSSPEGPPESAAQVSQRDFPQDNPLAGAGPAAVDEGTKWGIPALRTSRRLN